MLLDRPTARASLPVRALIWATGVLALALIVLAVQQLLADPAGADTPGLVGGVVRTVDQVVDPVSAAAPPIDAPAIESPAEAPVAEAPVAEAPAEPLVAVVEPLATVAKPLDSTVEAAAPVLDVAAPVVEAAAPVVAPLADAASPLTKAAVPIVDAVAPVTSPVVEAVTPVVTPVAEAVAPVVAPVVETVAPVVAPVVDSVFGAGAGLPTDRSDLAPSPPADTRLPLAVPSAVPGGLGGSVSGGAGPSVLLAILAGGVPGLGLARGGVVHDRAARLSGLVRGPGRLPG